MKLNMQVSPFFAFRPLQPQMTYYRLSMHLSLDFLEKALKASSGLSKEEESENTNPNNKKRVLSKLKRGVMQNPLTCHHYFLIMTQETSLVLH